MVQNNFTEKQKKPAGYLALISHYKLSFISHWHQSYVSTGGQHQVLTNSDTVTEIYPQKYWPGEGLGPQLEFAFKYDGINLAILASLFEVVKKKEVLNYIQSKPTGKYARKVWFFYEFITGKKLPLRDLLRGNYVDLLDPKKYYCLSNAHQVRRYRINNNLLGYSEFCPIVRKTKKLQQFEKVNFAKLCKKVVSAYSAKLLKRALSYLYNKETKSSFEIEKDKPNPTRTERFILLLEEAHKKDFCDKQSLIDLQNQIVDSRFQSKDYRNFQNFVGESVLWQNEKIHFACPKPKDLSQLMEGLIKTHQKLEQHKFIAVIHAAIIAYGFVFLHPFEDGNGRIHRFLIHNILARAGFTPKGLMFPVSASMLKNFDEYDASLEAFSKPLMPHIDYSLDDEGRMTIHNQTKKWYRYIDMTTQAEALFYFVKQTIKKELTEELVFLEKYDEAKEALKEIVDMPDRKIDLFIRFCLQNKFKLSSRKLSKYFDFLSKKEVSQMEKAVKAVYE